MKWHTVAQQVHEAFLADEELERAGMREELLHFMQTAMRRDDKIIGRRGREEEDSTSLMMCGGLV